MAISRQRARAITRARPSLVHRALPASLFCTIWLLIVCLAVSSHGSEFFGNNHHRLAKRDTGTIAGVTIGVLALLGLVGYAWLACTVPNFSPCGCCTCCDRNDDESVDIRDRPLPWYKTPSALEQHDRDMDLELQLEPRQSRDEQQATPQDRTHDLERIRTPRPVGHERIHSTTRMSGERRGKRTTHVANWVKDQSNIHTLGMASAEAAQSAEPGDIQQPRPVQLRPTRGSAFGSLNKRPTESPAVPGPVLPGHSRSPSHPYPESSHSPQPSLEEGTIVAESAAHEHAYSRSQSQVQTRGPPQSDHQRRTSQEFEPERSPPQTPHRLAYLSPTPTPRTADQGEGRLQQQQRTNRPTYEN